MAAEWDWTAVAVADGCAAAARGQRAAGGGSRGEERWRGGWCELGWQRCLVEWQQHEEDERHNGGSINQPTTPADRCGGGSMRNKGNKQKKASQPPPSHSAPSALRQPDACTCVEQMNDTAVACGVMVEKDRWARPWARLFFFFFLLSLCQCSGSGSCPRRRGYRAVAFGPGALIALDRQFTRTG